MKPRSEVSSLVSRQGSKCLSKMGKIGGVSSLTTALGRAAWFTIVSQIGSTIQPKSDRPEKCQAVVHPNLKIESKLLPSPRAIITARADEQLAAIKSLSSKGVVAGIRKAPSQ